MTHFPNLIFSKSIYGLLFFLINKGILIEIINDGKPNLNKTGSHWNNSVIGLLCFAKLAHVNNIDVNNLIMVFDANQHPPLNECAIGRLGVFRKQKKQHKWSLYHQNPEHSTSMKQKKKP